MSNQYQLANVVYTNQLKEIYGKEIVLFNAQEESAVFRILSEFSLGDQVYAILQSDEQRVEADFEVFIVSTDDQGHVELVTVEDDDVWENIAEIYDEMIFTAKDK